MFYLIIYTIFLCIQVVFGYYYPLSEEAQDELQRFVSSAKDTYSFSDWLEWHTPKAPEEVEPTTTEALIYWFGLKEKPVVVERTDEHFYVCIAVALTIWAIIYTIYITITGNTCLGKKPSSTLKPFLLEEDLDYSELEGTDDDSELDYEYDGSRVSWKSHLICPCACCSSCMNAAGDMK